MVRAWRNRGFQRHFRKGKDEGSKFRKVVLHGAKWPNFAPWRKSPCEMVFPWLDAVVLRRPYLPHFSSKSYTVWNVGFLTSWSLKWYMACKKWTSGSTPKVQRKTADAVLCFLQSVFPLSIALSLHTLNDFGKGLWSSKAWFLHEFELPKASPWTIYNSPSQLGWLGVAKSYQKHQNLTQFD